MKAFTLIEVLVIANTLFLTVFASALLIAPVIDQLVGGLH